MRTPNETFCAGSAARRQLVRTMLLAAACALVWAPGAAAQSSNPGGSWFWTTSLSGVAFPSHTVSDASTGSTSELRAHSIYYSNTLGYRANRYASVFVDAPIHFVRFCESDMGGAEQCASNRGIGDLGLSGQLRAGEGPLRFSTTGTLFLPTGDKEKGLGTGSVTAAWRNAGSLDLWRTMLFAELTLANTLTHTSSFVRPFASKGFVTEISGGLERRMLPFVRAGASVYRVMPSGTQTTFGRFQQQGTISEPPAQGEAITVGGPPVSGPRQPVLNPRFVASQGETVGGAELTRDYGASAWVRLPLHRNLDFQVTYTRSVRLNLHAVSYGVWINLTPVLGGR
jgi:hypothetical protein